ncbi:MAG TPA: S53 family serine peptidase [Myxococcales bacterium]|jgi:kumamolisin|nr:S53 family serine peptidase [Myxococcales bacterium]
MPSRNHVVLPGSARGLLSNSRAAGPVNLSETAELTVRIRSRGAELEQFVAKLSAQPVAARTYLSKAELAAQHGADPADLDAVERFAQQHNLLVAQRSQAERKIILCGKLGDLLNAFPAEVHLYHHATGTYRGRHGEIHVPAELSGIVTGVFGFDTRPKHRSPGRKSLLANLNGGNGVPASDYAKRYNFPTQAAGKTLDGAGETIAIIELGGGFSNTDLRTYFAELKAPLPNVVAVSVDHLRNSPGNDADGEVMLDIEVAGCVAPKANIAVYFGPNQGSGFIDAISAAVHDSERNPSVISISWGGPEDGEDQQSIDAYHEIFLAAAAQGVTICVASGDHGTADLDGQSWDGKIHVDHPSCDPYVLACGGTQIQDGADVVWNDGTAFGNVPGGGGWASGGGISAVFQLPDYQTAYFKGAPPKSIATNKPGRGVPDIAMSATNYFVRVQGVDQPSGGTSAVAPLAAALVALLNQAKQKKIGFLNPFLYANAAVMKDVTSGTNAITGTVKGYLAGQGWDACTGLGTPDGMAILGKL